MRTATKPGSIYMMKWSVYSPRAASDVATTRWLTPEDVHALVKNSPAATASAGLRPATNGVLPGFICSL